MTAWENVIQEELSDRPDSKTFQQVAVGRSPLFPAVITHGMNSPPGGLHQGHLTGGVPPRGRKGRGAAGRGAGVETRRFLEGPSTRFP